MSDVEMDVEPFLDVEDPDRFEVTIDGHAYVVDKETLRAFLSRGLRAIGHNGTELEAGR